MAAAEQALEDAGGLDGLSADPDRTGVLIGTGVGGLETMETQIIVHHEKGPRRVSPFLVPMMMSNAGAATVSMRFGFRGPCETTVTACAAGTHSIGNAARLIASGRCDVVLAGGCEAPLTPVGLAGVHQHDGAVQLAASPSPSTSRRDGFVIAEGGAVLVLEDWDRAVSPGRPDLRRGRRRRQHRRRPPHHRALARRRRRGRRAWSWPCIDAGLAPADIAHINAHGTSTPLNDAAEAEAITKVFGTPGPVGHLHQGRDRPRPRGGRSHRGGRRCALTIDAPA